MKRTQRLWALLLCMLLCVGLMPTTAFAADDPVITNLTVTRDSETTATITFDSTQAGSVAICFKNSDGTFGLYIGDKDGVTVGKNVITYEYLTGSEAKEMAVYFGTDESDFDALYSSQNPLDMPGAVKGTVPVVHTCASTGDWQYDPDNHWKLCDICGNKVDEAAHSGGTATCTAPAVCETCQQAYGSVNPDNHLTDKIVWTQTETTHSSAYDCCGAVVVAEEAHTYKWVTDKEPTATEAGSRHEECTVCGYVGATETIAATGTEDTPSDPHQTEDTPSDTDQAEDTPSATGDTTDSTTGDKTNPETGDSSNIMPWIALLLLSSGGLAGVIIPSRNRKAS